MKTATALLAAITTICGACGDVAGPRPGAAILLTAGAVTMDTIESTLAQPIHLQVFDERGKPMGGASVELRDARDQLGEPTNSGPKVFAAGGELYVSLEDARAANAQNRTSVVTDGAGRASAFLRLGREAGDVHVKAVYGEFRDSVLFQALPGAAVALAAQPADTAVLAGDSYSLTVFAVDRRGNRRPEVESNVTAVSAAPQLAQSDGATVDALSIGRVAIDLTSPTGAGQAHVSVVPEAVFAMTAQEGAVLPDGPPVMMTADGVTAAPIPGIDAGSCPAWHPTGDRLLLDGLRIVAGDGQQTQLSTGNPDLVAGCGRFSADGEWILFDGRLSTDPQTESQVWRIRADGTGLEQITAASDGSRSLGASSSPDGSRIAYTVQRADGYGYLVVHTLATGASDTIVTRGRLMLRASWSPTGEWIAYTHNPHETGYEVRRRVFVFAERLVLIRPDGTDEHDLPNPGDRFDHYLLGTVDWSTDGEWLVGKSFYVGDAYVPDLRIKLINTTTGETLPLNGATRSYSQPAWKP